MKKNIPINTNYTSYSNTVHKHIWQSNNTTALSKFDISTEKSAFCI